MLSSPKENAVTAAAPRREDLRLGDVLVQPALIPPEQLPAALELQRGCGKRLGRVLIDGGLVSQDPLAHDEVTRLLKRPVRLLQSVQNSRCTLRLRDRTIDVRLSTLPTPHGASVVMRRPRGLCEESPCPN